MYLPPQRGGRQILTRPTRLGQRDLEGPLLIAGMGLPWVIPPLQLKSPPNRRHQGWYAKRTNPFGLARARQRLSRAGPLTPRKARNKSFNLPKGQASPPLEDKLQGHRPCNTEGQSPSELEDKAPRYPLRVAHRTRKSDGHSCRNATRFSLEESSSDWETMSHSSSVKSSTNSSLESNPLSIPEEEERLSLKWRRENVPSFFNYRVLLCILPNKVRKYASYIDNVGFYSLRMGDYSNQRNYISWFYKELSFANSLTGLVSQALKTLIHRWIKVLRRYYICVDVDNEIVYELEENLYSLYETTIV